MLSFYIEVVVLAAAVWFCCSHLYRPIGRFFSGIWENVKNEIHKEDNKNE